MIAALRALRAALPMIAVAAVLILLTLVERRTGERDAARAETAAVRAEVRAATDAARRADLENTNRVRVEQDAITKKVVSRYEVELADVRARAERMRRDAAAVASRRGGPPVSAPGDAARDPAAPPGEGGLPTAPDFDALIATEQALQLNALIDWVEAQSAVEVSR